MKLPLEAHGIAHHDEDVFLSIRYQEFLPTDSHKNGFQLENENFNSSKIITYLIDDQPIEDIPTAWLKLYLLSLRFFRPNQLNLDNIFSVLPNVAWTSNGPIRAESLHG